MSEHVSGTRTRGLLWQLFLRSFFIQSVWNYKGMQDLGLCWVMLPVVDSENSTPEMYQRISEYYNGHPYLCGYIAGAGSALELAERGDLHIRLRKALSSPLGVIGDRIFWKTLKPLSGILACCGILGIIQGYHIVGVSIVLLSFMLYNAVHLWVRWKGVVDGYELQTGCAASLKKLENMAVIRVFSSSGEVLTGIFLALILGSFYFSKAGIETPALNLQAGMLILAGVFLLSLLLPTKNYAIGLMLILVTLLGFVN